MLPRFANPALRGPKNARAFHETVRRPLDEILETMLSLGERFIRFCAHAYIFQGLFPGPRHALWLSLHFWLRNAGCHSKKRGIVASEKRGVDVDASATTGCQEKPGSILFSIFCPQRMFVPASETLLQISCAEGYSMYCNLEERIVVKLPHAWAVKKPKHRDC